MHPVTGLAIWGLSSTSYPYLGYVVLDLEFLADVAGVLEKVELLSLVCPETPSHNDIAMIFGTNASLFEGLAQTYKDTVGPGFVKSVRIHLLCSGAYFKCRKPAPKCAGYKLVGHLAWIGPGATKLSPGCEVKLDCVR